MANIRKSGESLGISAGIIQSCPPLPVTSCESMEFYDRSKLCRITLLISQVTFAL